MAEIKRFFECLIPVTVCNLRCEYCYVIQREDNSQKVPKLDYTPEQMGQALTRERLGGVCYFSICGQGETFVPDYLIDIVYQLLKNGHYVNVTTNGTLTKKMAKLADLPAEWRSRLHIAFSLHYLELKRLNLLDTFFENVAFVKELGCSYLVQLNLYDGYLPYLEEIRTLCIEKVGAPPQLAATRKEESLTGKIDLMTDSSEEEYKKQGEIFQSPLFDFTMKNFNQPRKEFCYAGAWSYVLNLKTGVMKRCYASGIHQNIFKNPKEKLMELPVGNCCGSLYCLNSSHFMSLGVIPELDTPTYQSLRNREEAGWYSDDMRHFLSGKLEKQNTPCTGAKRIFINAIGLADKLVYQAYQFLKRRKK